jgi:hypothetical protein
VAVRDERNKRRELATDQTETRTRLAQSREPAKELEGVRLDTAAEARRLVAALQAGLPPNLRSRVDQAGFSGSLAR